MIHHKAVGKDFNFELSISLDASKNFKKVNILNYG